MNENSGMKDKREEMNEHDGKILTQYKYYIII